MANQNTQEIVNLVENPHSPYYLHHSDNHSSVIVTPELTTTNYSQWSRSFLLALSIRNKQGFVTGVIPCPDVNDAVYSAWKRCNDLIVAWLLRSVSPSIASTVFYFTSASQIWEVLRKRFSKPDDARICYLQQQLCVLTQGTKTVDVYFNELNAIWEELKLFRPLPYCSCGKCNIDCFERFAKAQEKDYVFKFLNGLNDSFRTLRSQVVMMKPFPSLDEAYNLVMGEESQRTYEMQSGSIDATSESSALAVQSNKMRNPNVICSNCKKPGHVKEKCYFLVGFPSRYSGNAGSNRSHFQSGNNSWSGTGFRNRKPQANCVGTQEMPVSGLKGADQHHVEEIKKVALSNAVGSHQLPQVEQLLPKMDQLLALLQTSAQSSSQSAESSSSAAGSVFKDYDWIR